MVSFCTEVFHRLGKLSHRETFTVCVLLFVGVVEGFCNDGSDDGGNDGGDDGGNDGDDDDDLQTILRMHEREEKMKERLMDLRLKSEEQVSVLRYIWTVPY